MEKQPGAGKWALHFASELQTHFHFYKSGYEEEKGNDKKTLDS